MWLLPSIRPHLVGRVFSVAPPSLPGLVVIEAQERELYHDVPLPAGWSLHVVENCAFYRDKMNRVFADFPSEPFYGVLGDDMVALTPGWDVTLSQRAGARNVVGSSQVHIKTSLGAGAIGGDLVRALGWLCLPCVKHFYSDTVLQLIGEEFGCLKICADVEIEHHHFTVGLAKKDESYRRRGSSSEDRRAFEVWKQAEWPALKERLRPLYQ